MSTAIAKDEPLTIFGCPRKRKLMSLLLVFGTLGKQARASQALPPFFKVCNITVRNSDG